MIPRLQAGSEVTVPSRRWGEKVSLLPVAAEMLLDEVGKIGSRSLTEEFQQIAAEMPEKKYKVSWTKLEKLAAGH